MGVNAYHLKLLLIASIFCVNAIKCTEYVPVYVWGTSKSPALSSPALQSEFSAAFLERIEKQKTFVVVFAEKSLGAEDFALQEPDSGASVFSSLNELRQSAHYGYWPNVEDPIGTLKKQLNGGDVEEAPVDLVLSESIVPKNVIIVNLDAAREGEARIDLLKRHDAEIAKIYNQLVQRHKNVIAIYTGQKSSWAPSEKSESAPRVRRSAQVAGNATNQILYRTDYAFLYLHDLGLIQTTNENITFGNSSKAESTIIGGTNITFTLTVNKDNKIDQGYWFLTSAKLNSAPLLVPRDLFAPFTFSYHCGDMVFISPKEPSSLPLIKLPGFQVQPFTSKVDNAKFRFNDAYDCVGFTSIPIWSGIFVTFLLLAILTFGLTMIMDIKTMDRFDDPKGKGITVSAE